VLARSVGEVHGECGARPNASDDILRPDLWHRVPFLEGRVKERRRDVGLSGAEHDHERRALGPELPLAFVNNVAEIAEIPSAMRVNRNTPSRGLRLGSHGSVLMRVAVPLSILSS